MYQNWILEKSFFIMLKYLTGTRGESFDASIRRRTVEP